MPDSTYSIKLRGIGVPLEIPTLVDGSDVKRAIHSSIDRKLYGLKGLTSTLVTINSDEDSDKQVAYISYTTTTAGVELEIDIIPHGLGTVDVLVIAITAAGSTGTPDCEISVDGVNYDQTIQGVGDFVILRLADIEGNVIKLKSSGATKLAVVDVLIMYESVYLRDSASKYLQDSADEFLRVGR